MFPQLPFLLNYMYFRFIYLDRQFMLIHCHCPITLYCETCIYFSFDGNLGHFPYFVITTMPL